MTSYLQVRLSQGVNLVPYNIGPKLIRPCYGISVNFSKSVDRWTTETADLRGLPVCRNLKSQELLPLNMGV